MKQPVHRLPRRALGRVRSTSRSGVAVAKELVRVEFEKQRLQREIDRLQSRMTECEAAYAHNSEQSLLCCTRLLSDDPTVV